MRQYFIEDDTTELPFSRVDRSLVYQRAKRQEDKRPFGTQGDVYRSDYEWINHSMTPTHPDAKEFRITVGGPDCTQPYSLRSEEHTSELQSLMRIPYAVFFLK